MPRKMPEGFTPSLRLHAEHFTYWIVREHVETIAQAKRQQVELTALRNAQQRLVDAVLAEEKAFLESEGYSDEKRDEWPREVREAVDRIHQLVP